MIFAHTELWESHIPTSEITWTGYLSLNDSQFPSLQIADNYIHFITSLRRVNEIKPRWNIQSMECLILFLIIVSDPEFLVFWADSMEKKKIWGYFQECRSSNRSWNLGILLIEMKPGRIWQSEEKMSVGGSESVSKIKEKFVVSLHGELAIWSTEKKVHFLSSDF